MPRMRPIAACWFTIPRFGAAASHAAWSIVQHQTNDPAFMAAMLARRWPERPDARSIPSRSQTDERQIER